MKSFLIGENDCSQRIDKFIQKVCPKMPKSLMYKYIRKKRVKLNSKRCEPCDFLQKGDLVEMYVSDEFFCTKDCAKEFSAELSRKVNIVYEDKNIAILYKEANLPCHSSDKSEKDTLVDRFLAYLYEKGEYSPEDEAGFRPALCNRLDRNTCGLVIGAKNACALREMNKAIRENRVKKSYLCLSASEIPKDHEILHAYLTSDSSENKVTVSDDKSENSKEIITEYTKAAENGRLTLLEIDLHTGRKHQIRAHLAHEGIHILGDIKYGNPIDNREFSAPCQALCAYKLKFCFDNDSPLSYLDEKVFKTDNIWFLKKYF